MDAYLIGSGNFKGYGYRSLFEVANTDAFYGVNKAADSENPTVHIIDHPTLGKFTAYMWQMPLSDKRMEHDEFNRPIAREARAYGVVVPGHVRLNIDAAQRDTIRDAVVTVHDRLWYERQKLPDNTSQPLEVGPERKIALREAANGRGLPLITGRKIDGSNFTPLQDLSQLDAQVSRSSKAPPKGGSWFSFGRR